MSGTLGNQIGSLEESINTTISELESSIDEQLSESSTNLPADVLSVVSVNYAARISAGATFTAPSDGLVTYSGEYPNTSNAWVRVNGVNVVHVGDNATGSTYNAVMLPLKKNDKVANGFGTGYFFPYKGVV